VQKISRWCWVLLFGGLIAITSPAQTFKTVEVFDFYKLGGYPQLMSLIQTKDGSLYGTTALGGGPLVGTIFQITTSGQMNILCYFGEGACVEEDYPYAGLIEASDGNFYGTTWQGGANKTGTVYEITPSGTLTLLYSFCSLTNCSDGADPYAPLIQATDGNFYGTTLNGGSKGYGTIFKITSTDSLTTLHSFRYADGASPTAGLIQARNGKFYGTTLYGGTNGGGTVFQITSAGKLKSLYSFCSQRKCGDGANPYLGLVQATNGKFYGTTYAGGAHGHGTVFSITTAGKLTALYSFCSQKKCADGADPIAGVIQATDGNFYGVASRGGMHNRGTIFQITAAGQLMTLYSFCAEKACADGATPSGGLLQAADGTFYGTTTDGGTYGYGTVFNLSMGLKPQ